MSTKVSYWLIPATENRAFFQEIIDSLASQYDAPRFTPHVTIYSGESSPHESPSELIETATQGIQGFTLNVEKLLYTNEFTKTLFVQFHPSEMLRQLSETIQRNAKKPSSYSLNPHLSLIYQDLSESVKQHLITSIHLPQTEIFFDEVKAISTPSKVQRREDVENWQEIFSKKLQ